MITAEGYSKDTSIKPEGIVITWPPDIIAAKGGIPHFIDNMKRKGDFWMHKVRAKPKFDILYVYIIVDGYLKYRCNYAGFCTGETITNGDYTHSWSLWTKIDWSRIILTGPIEMPEKQIKMSGFQSYRYCTKLF